MNKVTCVAGLLMVSAIIANGQSVSDQSNKKHLKSEKMENVSMNLVSEFLTAVQKGNMEKVGTMLHPEVEWSQPGNNAVSGIKKSAAEVFGMVGKMFTLSSNTLSLSEIKILAANADKVACLVHWKATSPSGMLLDIDNIDVYEIANGKIIKATVYSADIEKENIFWGNK